MRTWTESTGSTMNRPGQDGIVMEGHPRVPHNLRIFFVGMVSFTNLFLLPAIWEDLRWGMRTFFQLPPLTANARVETCLHAEWNPTTAILVSEV